MGSVQNSISGTLSDVPLGLYAGNPGDAASGNYPGYDAQFDGFTAAMGRAPTLFLTYMDQSVAPNDSNFGWTAQGAYFAGINAGDTRTAHGIPCIGLPGGWNSGSGNNVLYAGIVAGTWDTQIKGMLGGWLAAGYKTLYIRFAWEFNIGVNYPVTSANVATFVSAFQHVASLCHAYATANGMTIKMVWNPNVGPNQNDASVTLAQSYPGDAAVDVLAIDTYGAPVDGSNPPTNTTTNDGKTWTVFTMLSMGLAHGKTVAFGEVGGIDTNFATEMVAALQLSNTTERQGVTIEFMNMWDIDDDSGNLSWSNSSDGQAALAAIWKGGFGPTSAPTVTVASVQAQITAAQSTLSSLSALLTSASSNVSQL